MPDCHLIQIEDEALFLAAAEGKNEGGFYAELGQKIFRLCNSSNDPTHFREMTCESLGISMTALAWRGLATADRDEVFYWGSALKGLTSLSDGELKLAAKRIQQEIERRERSKEKNAKR